MLIYVQRLFTGGRTTKNYSSEPREIKILFIFFNDSLSVQSKKINSDTIFSTLSLK